MKKLLFLALLLIFFGGQRSFAAINCNLQFTDSIVASDTVFTGSSYKVYVMIKNEGPDSFKGNISFHAYVAKKNADLDINNPQTTFVLDSNGGNYYVIPPHGKAVYTKYLLFVDNYFTLDSTNIVIIWPAGAGAKPSLLNDNYKTDNFAHPFLRLFVKGAAKAGNNKGFGSLPQNINFFPNPAVNNINVTFKKAAKGTLRIVDMSGALVKKVDVQSDINSLNIALTKDNALLPSGVYILSYETSQGIETRKFVISE